MKSLIVFGFIFLLNTAWASSIHFDLGQSSTVYNRFSIPNSQANQISTPTDETLTSYRVTGYFDMGNNNQLYLMLAPLEVDYSFTSDKSFTFNDTDFSNSDTDITYKFNSYRFGYLWRWQKSRLRYWLGVVGKIRDAKIKVSQNSQSDSYDNIGFVPLFALGFELALSQSLRIFSHTDALGSSQGQAYDSQIELKWMTSSFAISGGKRILGGGADNDEVYTFAQFDTYYLRLSSYF